MNQTTSIFTLLLLAVSMMLFSCRKKAEDDKVAFSSADQTIGSNDETFFSSLLDQVIDDADGFFAGPGLAGAKTASYSVCSALVDSTNFSVAKKFTLTFDDITGYVIGTRRRKWANRTRAYKPLTLDGRRSGINLNLY